VSTPQTSTMRMSPKRRDPNLQYTAQYTPQATQFADILTPRVESNTQNTRIADVNEKLLDESESRDQIETNRKKAAQLMIQVTHLLDYNQRMHSKHRLLTSWSKRMRLFDCVNLKSKKTLTSNCESNNWTEMNKK